MRNLIINNFLLILFSSFLNGQSHDDFENGTTQGWGSGTTEIASNIATGGPDGADDNYMQIAPDGSGSGGRMVVFNTAQWTGDFTNNNVTKISFHVNNISGSSDIDLRISLRINGGGVKDNNSWASSTDAIPISSSPGWQTYSFPIDSDDLTSLGSSSISSILSDVGETRIVDATSAPSRQGDFTTDLIGIDNITVGDIPVSITEPKLNTSLPVSIEILQNYPNPFNPSTSINLQVFQSSLPVNLDIYNMMGQKIQTLFKGTLNSGSYSFDWDGRNLRGFDAPSGVYIYKLISQKMSISKKMMLLR